MSICRAIGIYNVPATIIRCKMKGHIAKSDSYNARSNLTKIEEEVIV